MNDRGRERCRDRGTLKKREESQSSDIKFEKYRIKRQTDRQTDRAVRDKGDQLRLILYCE